MAKACSYLFLLRPKSNLFSDFLQTSKVLVRSLPLPIKHYSSESYNIMYGILNYQIREGSVCFEISYTYLTQACFYSRTGRNSDVLDIKTDSTLPHASPQANIA
jgi:hypothetical protein